MLKFLCVCLLSCIVLHLSKAERRVLDGKPVTDDRHYVVYMIKANPSVLYDAWLCGGAIVSPFYILTSAACVEDVKHMYAIAGYKKYVPYEELNNDRCTKEYKKKIVYVCLPEEYDFDYPRVEQWANIDIALVKVESKYNFNDRSYASCCSYTPKLIAINYDESLQEPGTNAIVFGWGHTKKWRSEEDTKDYNQDNILYGAVRLAPKEQCMKFFDDKKFKNTIQKYMICSIDEGNIDDTGDVIKEDDNSKYKKHCSSDAYRLGSECLSDYRRKNANATYYGETRRKGICQNDHGGPLISWRGPKEVVIGIASVFRVQGSNKRCIPPFLYTSTHCNGAFLRCLVEEDNEPDKIELANKCNNLARQGGFKIIRRSISWADHPDGPAENEVDEYVKDDSDNTNVHMRSQIRFKNLGLK